MSTADQAESGLGIQAQRDAIGGVTASRWGVVAEYADEGVSGAVAPMTVPDCRQRSERSTPARPTSWSSPSSTTSVVPSPRWPRFWNEPEIAGGA